MIYQIEYFVSRLMQCRYDVRAQRCQGVQTIHEGNGCTGIQTRCRLCVGVCVGVCGGGSGGKCVCGEYVCVGGEEKGGGRKRGGGGYVGCEVVREEV